MSSSIDCRSILSKEEFLTEYLKQSKPVVLSGGISEWPALSRWTNEYLKTKCSIKDIYAHQIKGLDSFEDNVFDWKLIKFSDYIDSLDGGPTQEEYYVGNKLMSLYFPDLLADIVPPPYFEPHRAVKNFATNIWIGRGNNIAPLHYDRYQNLLTQVRGEKEVTLYAPKDHSKMAVHSSRNIRYNFSRINIKNPDLTQFPSFANATAYKVHIKPGDILYIPPFWWHTVKGIGSNISVNFWWYPRLSESLKNPLIYLHGLIADGFSMYRNFKKKKT